MQQKAPKWTFFSLTPRHQIPKANKHWFIFNMALDAFTHLTDTC